MPFKLINRKGEFPTGGWLFQDPRTGKKFKDGDFDNVVQQIRLHRLANPNIYPPEDGQWFDTELVSRELEKYTCDRLGNNPRFCADGVIHPISPAPDAKIVTMPTPCIKCGETQGRENYCASCSGRRVTGYSCVACGFLRGK